MPEPPWLRAETWTKASIWAEDLSNKRAVAMTQTFQWDKKPHTLQRSHLNPSQMERFSFTNWEHVNMQIWKVRGDIGLSIMTEDRN